DLSVGLLLVVGVLWRYRRNPSETVEACSAFKQLAADLDIAAANLQPDVVRVLDHVDEPRRIRIRAGVRGNDEPGILAVGESIDLRGALPSRSRSLRPQGDDRNPHLH